MDVLDRDVGQLATHLVADFRRDDPRSVYLLRPPQCSPDYEVSDVGAVRDQAVVFLVRRLAREGRHDFVEVEDDVVVAFVLHDVGRLAGGGRSVDDSDLGLDALRRSKGPERALFSRLHLLDNLLGPRVPRRAAPEFVGDQPVGRVALVSAGEPLGLLVRLVPIEERLHPPDRGGGKLLSVGQVSGSRDADRGAPSAVLSAEFQSVLSLTLDSRWRLEVNVAVLLRNHRSLPRSSRRECRCPRPLPTSRRSCCCRRRIAIRHPIATPGRSAARTC